MGAEALVRTAAVSRGVSRTKSEAAVGRPDVIPIAAF